MVSIDNFLMQSTCRISELNSFPFTYKTSQLSLSPSLAFTAQTLLISALLESGHGLWPSSISANSWSNLWYMELTPFEGVFLCFIMLEIAFLRYVEILPLNVNNLFYGDPSGRKRRRKRQIGYITVCDESMSQQHKIVESIFTIMKKLDRQECVLRTLCEIESFSSCNNKSAPLPGIIQRIVSDIKRTKSQNDTEQCTSQTPHFTEMIRSYQKAIQIGYQNVETGVLNGTKESCEKVFTSCPIKTEDVRYYLDKIYS